MHVHTHTERHTPQVILYSVPCNVLHLTDKNFKLQYPFIQEALSIWTNKVKNTATKHLLCPGNGVCLTLTRLHFTVRNLTVWLRFPFLPVYSCFAVTDVGHAVSISIHVLKYNTSIVGLKMCNVPMLLIFGKILQKKFRGKPPDTVLGGAQPPNPTSSIAPIVLHPWTSLFSPFLSV